MDAKYQEYKSWLAGLKAGDDVAVDLSRYGAPSFLFRPVSRASATQVIVDGISFRRSDGWQRGDVGRYGRKSICHVDDAHRRIEAHESKKTDEEKAKDARRRIESAIQRMALGQLLRVESAIKEAQGGE